MQMFICAISSRYLVIFSVFLWMTVLPLTCVSIEVDDLYVAEVLVPNENSTHLRAAGKSGLLQVLVRVSGDAQVQEHPLVKEALRRPADYYYQYSFESTNRSLPVTLGNGPAQLLRLNFEPSAIARLLREAGLPVWGSNRPSVLLWVVINEGADRRIVNETDASDIVANLSMQAKRRGLPVLFPILDLEDTARISAAEVWGGFLRRIGEASQRYEPDVVLTARIREESGRWVGKWSYRLDEDWFSLEFVAMSVSDLAKQLMDRIADELAARYSLTSSRATIALSVRGVTDLNDYAALSAYLEKLTPVLSSTVVNLKGDTARYELNIEGQLLQLVEIIELDERLILLDTSSPDGTLNYHWQGR